MSVLGPVGVVDALLIGVDRNGVGEAIGSERVSSVVLARKVSLATYDGTVSSCNR